MPYDVGVSQYLQGKGVSSNDIGYDQNSGNVTVKGQPFYKPELNMAGTTYSSQPNLDNAYNNYSIKSQQPVNVGGMTGVNAGTSTPGAYGQNIPSSPAPTNDTPKPASSGYTNPYTQMIGDLIKHLSDTSNAPQQDIYSSPQYAAAQAAQERTSGQAIRQANESAAGAGLGHSTIMTDRSQRIQDDSNNYLQTQLVPQIQAQLAQQRQQELANQENQLRDYMNLGQQADSQHNADRSFDAGRQDAATAATGIFNPSGKSVQDVQAQMDAISKAYATASPEEQQRLHAENMQLAGLLGKTYDPSTGTYSQGQGFVGTPTLQAQQFAYQQTRDAIKDKQYQQTFDNNVKQQGLDFALKQATLANQITNDQAQRAIGYMNAKTSAASSANSNENMKQDNLMNIWKATGQAPAGITGVAEGTPYAQAQNTNLKSDKEISDLLDSSPFVTKQLDESGKVIGTAVSDTNKKQMAQYIASLGLPVTEAKKWFIRYGLSLTGN